jgi:NADH:ubiquinone oxidoreductase subunit H
MTAFIVIIFVFFAIVSLLFLLGWHSHRDSNMLGGIILMVLALVIFIAILLMAAQNRQQENPSVRVLPGISPAPEKVIGS